jgi:hypothetical protein
MEKPKKYLSKECAVRFYALVFHMAQSRARGMMRVADPFGCKKSFINLRTFSG